MKHKSHIKFAVAILSAIVVASPGIVFAAEDGLGTNVLKNVRIQPAGAIDLGGTAITNWFQIGSTADVASLQSATGSLNTAVGNLNVSTTSLNTAVGALNTATNSLNARAVRWDGAVLNKTGTAGDAIAFANVYYFGIDGSWSNASAASSATSRGMLGLALGGTIGTDGMLVNGPCTNAWGFNSGSILYLATNANQITAARPTGTNHIVRIVGYAVDASTIFFNPDRTYIEIVGD